MQYATKKDYQKLLLKMLNPLKALYSAGGARLHLGETAATYDPVAAQVEAFARPLWGLVPFWAGGGENADFEEIYKKGLAAGTNPKHEEYWGGFIDCDQRFVEMAPIALGLMLCPQVLWKPLTGEEKQNLASWLYGINKHKLPECNWYFFRVLVNLALKKCNMPYDEKMMETDLEMIESWYLGKGWYVDGASNRKDYYVPFAMHFYGLIYAKLVGEEDDARSKRFCARAKEFAQDFILWFADDGESLPYGRSLSYRFAKAAFWPACIFAEVDVFSYGVIKGVLSRHLEFWMDKPIFDREGVLSIGYAYPNLNMAEKYNAPGSSYWCTKSFLALALADDHPFWQADIEYMPKLKSLKALPKAHMLVQRASGEVTSFVAGGYGGNMLGHFVEKYSKFAYSTQFGFSVAQSQYSLEENAPDSMLAFVVNENIYVRKTSIEYTITEENITCRWSPATGITVTTKIIPTEKGHVRLHKIESDIACLAYDCGFAVQKYTKGFEASAENEIAQVKNASGACSVKGKGNSAKAIIIEAAPNTNLLFPNTDIPAVCYNILQGTSELATVIETWKTQTNIHRI